MKVYVLADAHIVRNDEFEQLVVEQDTQTQTNVVELFEVSVSKRDALAKTSLDLYQCFRIILGSDSCDNLQRIPRARG